MRIQTLSALLLAFVSIISSCSKDDKPGNGTADIQSSADNAFAESTSNDAVAISTQSEDNGVTGNYQDLAFSYLLSPCADVTINLAASPYLLTVDFGNSNCLCYDGKYRRGKILVSFTGLYRDSASKHTITYDGFYVNNYKVEGSTSVINNGHNKNGNLNFTVQVNEKITDSTGRQLTYTSTRAREWIAGESTEGFGKWTDDVYSITGSANGTTFTGETFTSNITGPLIVALNCRWIEAGKIEFAPSGKLTRTIDFGNGDCDNKIVITIAGISFTVLLP